MFMEATTSTTSGLEPLLSIEALSEYLDVPVTTIRERTTIRRHYASEQKEPAGVSGLLRAVH